MLIILKVRFCLIYRCGRILSWNANFRYSWSWC